MNLLIEQRPTTITSNLQPQSHVSSTQNEVNTSSSPLVLKLKRHTTNNQQENDLRSTSTSSMADDESHLHARSTPTNQRLKRITTTTTNSTTTATRRSTSPAFNGKQQASKRSVTTIDSNNNDLTAQTDDISASSKRFKSNEFNVSFVRSYLFTFLSIIKSHRKYPFLPPLSLDA